MAVANIDSDEDSYCSKAFHWRRLWGSARARAPNNWGGWAKVSFCHSPKNIEMKFF